MNKIEKKIYNKHQITSLLRSCYKYGRELSDFLWDGYANGDICLCMEASSFGIGKIPISERCVEASVLESVVEHVYDGCGLPDLFNFLEDDKFYILTVDTRNVAWIKCVMGKKVTRKKKEPSVKKKQPQTKKVAIVKPTILIDWD